LATQDAADRSNLVKNKDGRAGDGKGNKERFELFHVEKALAGGMSVVTGQAD